MNDKREQYLHESSRTENEKRAAWHAYEREKTQLQKMGLSPEDYEAAVRELAAKWGV